MMSLTNTQVEILFNQTFGNSYKTQLIGGYDEPEYFPPSDTEPAKICYRSDYVQSALHEVAHWCVAGKARRELHDYGYLYSPDGRDEIQQEAFFKVESRPQALEWLFSSAAGLSFRPSIDNLSNGSSEIPENFVQELKKEAKNYLLQNKSTRAMEFLQALDSATTTDANTSSIISLAEIAEAKF